MLEGARQPTHHAGFRKTLSGRLSRKRSKKVLRLACTKVFFLSATLGGAGMAKALMQAPEQKLFGPFSRKRTTFFLAFLLLIPVLATAKVVSLNLCTDQLLVLLAPEQVEALEPLARDPALSFVASQAAGLAQVRANAEAVLALHPDLVLAGRYGAQVTVGLLRARGVRVVQFDEAVDFPSVALQVGRIADLLGVPERGRAMVSAMWRRLAAVRKRAGSAVFWEASGWTAGPGSFGDAVLRAAGLSNFGTGGRIGVERLLADRPDLLVTEAAARFPSMATDLAWHPALAGMARRIVQPPLIVCAGPWSVAAVEVLSK